MIISHDHKIIFIHIPKTAGVSIKSALKRNNYYEGKIHITIGGAQKIIEEQKATRYTKIAVVRNPWDRMVSLYCQFWKVRDNYTPKVGGPGIVDRTFKYFVMEMPENLPGFDDFRKMQQINWIDNSFIVSRYENLSEDLKWLNLPRLNISDRTSDYTKYYDEETKEYVSDVFKDDIKRFGYKY